MLKPDTLLIPRLKLAGDATPAQAAAVLAEQVAPTRLQCVNWPQEYPEHPEVDFRLGHRGDALWLRFDVREERVRALATEPHGAVYNDSCVELFISFDNHAYYNLELNCIGTPLLGYGKGRACRRSLPPQAMEQLVVESSLGQEPFAEKSGGFKWRLTACVPLACFAFDALDSLNGRAARANLYKCNSGVSVKHYLSWRPIRTAAPDFHRPEFFGAVAFA